MTVFIVLDSAGKYSFTHKFQRYFFPSPFPVGLRGKENETDGRRIFFGRTVLLLNPHSGNPLTAISQGGKVEAV